MQYLVVIERGASSFGAYVPDLPGCIAAGESREEVTVLIHEAIELHIEDLRALFGCGLTFELTGPLRWAGIWARLL